MTRMTLDDYKKKYEGQIVYFVKLHLDTLKKERPLHLDPSEGKVKRPQRDKLYVYTVVGKSRPMLVMTCLPKEYGKFWFLVCPITSEGLDENKKLRENMQRMGNCIDPERDSFIETEPQKLPDNMIDAIEGTSPVKDPCNRMCVDNAMKVLMYKSLHKKCLPEAASENPSP